MPAAKVACRTPTPGKTPTNVDAHKFNLVRDAILDVLREAGDDGVAFMADLPDAVGARLTEDIGSVGWYTTTVKLELEVRGEIERVPGSKPQRLRLAVS
ncbi:MAG: hypothetical protein AAGD32_10310 [Planctomycetota bacterium]